MREYFKYVYGSSLGYVGNIYYCAIEDNAKSSICRKTKERGLNLKKDVINRYIT